jgi:hypothetical protein
LLEKSFYINQNIFRGKILKNRVLPTDKVALSVCFPSIERVKGIEPSFQAWGFCDICGKKIEAGVHTIHLAMEAYVWEHMREWNRKDAVSYAGD